MKTKDRKDRYVDSPIGKYLLIFIALSFLAVMIYIPLMALLQEVIKGGWSTLIGALTDRNFRNACWLTVLTALVAVPLNTVFGLCTAWIIARHRFPGRTFLITLIDLPFSISPVVVGLMLVLLYGRQGWLGGFLEAINFRVIFSLPGIILATAFVSMPFVAREVMPILEEIGKSEEEAAKTLGASGWQTFWYVTVPNIRWGILYGVLLTNARAMGEFGAVSVVSGNIGGKTQTLPLFIEDVYLNYQTAQAFAASIVLALLALVTLVVKELLERRSGYKSKPRIH
ncbi:MAG: sulfate ABC transporter permease subunit CysW [Cyanobacteria bacterium M5B4]|nr:sulfate ABC transporter permease subunit CysW [Cyanobacteria bacterium KgW148]PLS69044.1 MAG: sulfate ABC transporter permease subunit CysW [Cyanobacteria bacterium M5B4]